MKHLYKPLYRPAHFAGLPAGWDYVEAPMEIALKRPLLPLSRHPFGVIAYDRKLTEQEVKDHQLEYVGAA